MRPMSLAALGKKYGRGRSTIREIFVRRKLFVRPLEIEVKRLPNGSFQPIRQPTAKEIEAKIRTMCFIKVPEDYRILWRKWPTEKRRAFVHRLREHLKSPLDRPTGQYSFNVEPFDYFSDRAQKIAKIKNAGRPSNQWAIHLKLKSEGVIYKGELYFWSSKCGGYYSGGTWTPENGRPALHHLIWEEWNKCTVPAHCTVICKDGNKNNLGIENLTLRSKAECARMNISAHHIKNGRAALAAAIGKAA